MSDIVNKYGERGFRLLFYRTRTKGPAGVDAKGWTERSDKPEEFKEGDNVGCFTGVEVAPGRFLVDVDFDWPEGLVLAKRLLPATGFGFGRTSRQISHSFYTTSIPLVSKEYNDVSGRVLVEIRAAKSDGSIGFQTMLPPSIHPSGEQVILRMDGEIGHSDELARRVTLYAIACILLLHLGQRGLLHDTRMALAGFLLQEGLTEDEVIAIGESIAEASGNDVSDVRRTAETTAKRLKNGERVHGKTALVKAIGEDIGKSVLTRIRDWLGGGEFFENGKGPVANHQGNIEQALKKLDVKLSFDTFSQKPVIQYNGYNGTMQDFWVRSVWLEIDRQFNFRPQKEFFFDVVQELAAKNTFHPILDYLKTLEWDGKPRVDEWLIRAGKAADTEYVRAVSALVLIAAVRRVVKPGCKFDEMLVLESGTQGFFKSTALRTLCPKEEWFSDDLPLNVEAKQIVERTQGKWLIEASDLSGMRSSQVEQLKATLSRQVDGPVRMAYARLAVEQPRQFVLIGTTNSYTYLADTTGNRRFWPVRVEQFDIEWIRENRDQLWAEAAHREASGEPIRLNPHLYAMAGMQQERRRVTDAWEDTLSKHFDGPFYRLTPDDIWSRLNIPIERRDARAQHRVMHCMQVLGFRRCTVRDEETGKNVKGWAKGDKTHALGLSHEEDIHD